TGLPWYDPEGRCLVHLGASYQYRDARFNSASGTNVVAFRGRPEIFTGNGFVGDNNRFLDTGLIQAADVQTANFEVAAVLGPFSMQSEYTLVNVQDASYPAGKKGKALGNPTFQGFYVQASYFLTGENRTYDKRFGRFDRIRPNTNVWLVRGEDGPSF